MRIRLLVLIALLAVTVVGVPVQAQEGPSEEELALLDRVQTARDILHGRSSYTELSVGEQTQTLTAKLGVRTQTATTVRTWDRTASVLREGGELSNAQIFLTMEFDNAGTVDSSPFTVTGEARLVDGVLYVNGAFEDASAVPPGLTLPEGWVTVENDGRYPVLERLGLEGYLDETSPFDNEEVLKEAVTHIASEPGVLEDGTAVDYITFTFDAAGVGALYASMKDLEPATLHIVEHLAGDTHATLVLALDADNTAYIVHSEIIFDAAGLDPAVFGVNNANAAVRFDMSQSQTQTYSDFDAPVAPVDAPAVLAE